MHGAAIENLSGHLYGTHNDRLILDTNSAKSFRVYDNKDFCGYWYSPAAIDDPPTEKSQSGFVILYAGCPIVWA